MSIDGVTEEFSGDYQTQIDINLLADQLEAKLCDVPLDDGGRRHGSPECHISIVKPQVRLVDVSQYAPQVLLVGAYHHRSLDRCELDKLAALRRALPDGDDERASTLRRYLAAIADLESEARSYYRDDTDDMSAEEFALMLLLDGWYILHYFGVGDGGGGRAVDIFAVRDVFYLLENQIPFFILEKVYELIHSPPPSPGATAIAGGGSSSSSVVVVDGRARATVYRWRRATQYHAAGVRFKRRALGLGDARCVLDVELRRLTLHVPTLTVDNNTWRVLRNLMALEQNNPNLGSHVTAYCLFMSHLAGTARDVDLLARKKIIVHFMGCDEDVADGFAGLCRGVALSVDDARQNYLQPTWERMERWYSSRPVNWMALLRRRHLSNPLVAIALLAAIAGLVCEVLQAVYAVKSYKTRS
ncbi:hypothetical protein OsI_30804 [Oryza sativa Indica Group]|uniref:Uncharacterized protein n=1 Tax=Oryza sativa subsp. indica TaxID=39946 RepID=A2YZM3_ORYSI|nr:hypothetical protein OsI_30804 [Oryza sativa Indica Group]